MTIGSPGAFSAATFRLFLPIGTGLADSLSKCRVLPLEPTWVRQMNKLTRHEWQTVQVVPPLLRDGHRLALVGLSFTGKPGSIGMRDQLRNVLWMDSVEHCVEVRSIGLPVPCVLVLHVPHNFWVLLELGENVVNTELVELGDVDELAFAHFEETLLAFENLAKEVPICCSAGGTNYCTSKQN